MTWTIGLFLVVGALVTSSVLAADALGFVQSLPGCGPSSGCAKATSGPWGHIIGWPTSFLGVAWFWGLFLAWVSGPPSRHTLWCIRLGVIGSLFLGIIMVQGDAICRWCAWTHGFNFSLWICAESLVFGRAQPGQRGFARGAIALVGVTIVLAVLLPIRKAAITERDAQRLVESQQQIVEGTSDRATLALLEARHRAGATDAAVQVVMFTDYQCPDCRRLEGQMDAILHERDDVSLAIKHFPLCAPCNEYMNGRTIHGNACWAARASEAAAILGGEDAFWRMHRWLFERRGSFTDATFPGDLRALGFDSQQFITTMSSQQTMDLIRRDTDAASALGVFYTPMVFINGVEYTWYLGDAGTLRRTIELAAASPGAITAPPVADEKLFEDWRLAQPRRMPGTDASSWIGDGPIEVVAWGDYQSETSRRLDRVVRTLLEQGANLRYTWRHFPIDEACNATVARYNTKYPGSCDMAKVVEAAWELGGDAARWAMHAWLVDNPSPMGRTLLAARAAEVTGLDAARLLAAMDGPGIDARIQVDIAEKRRTWDKHMPVLVIDDRFVPRWSSESVPGDVLISRILKHAAQGASR